MENSLQMRRLLSSTPVLGIALQPLYFTLLYYLPGDRLIRLHFVNYSLAGTNYKTILRASGHLYKIIQILKIIL